MPPFKREEISLTEAYDYADDSGDLSDYTDDERHDAARALLDDIDDRINAEFMTGEPSIAVTAQSSRRFRTIPEEG